MPGWSEGGRRVSALSLQGSGMDRHWLKTSKTRTDRRHRVSARSALRTNRQACRRLRPRYIKGRDVKNEWAIHATRHKKVLENRTSGSPRLYSIHYTERRPRFGGAFRPCPDTGFPDLARRSFPGGARPGSSGTRQRGPLPIRSARPARRRALRTLSRFSGRKY